MENRRVVGEGSVIFELGSLTVEIFHPVKQRA
jgi:hypothetical protein